MEPMITGMSIDDISNFMSMGNYFTFHKSLAKQLGLDEAIVLGELINLYPYHYYKGTLVDGMFYCTVKKMEDDTTLSEYKQRRAIKNLEEKGLIITTLKGIPPKRYIGINPDMVIEYLRKA